MHLSYARLPKAHVIERQVEHLFQPGVVHAKAPPGRVGHLLLRELSPIEPEPVTYRKLTDASYQQHVPGADTFVHLIGVSHPSPTKAREFEAIDRKSAFEAIAVARDSGIRHFGYVSVAHPAPAMHAYIAARSACESEIEAARLNATILRPWYVLGPGHRWPYLLKPAYKLAEWIPQTRAGARRLGLVTLDQMISALVAACESPHPGVRVWEVPDIRKLGNGVAPV